MERHGDRFSRGLCGILKSAMEVLRSFQGNHVKDEDLSKKKQDLSLLC